MAEERYARLPLIGHVPDPVFSRFDGHRFDLEDGCVERVACNDAFHHVANPTEVLTEFARVLAPAGMCVMSEPGPGHSRSTAAQAEMRSFRVVERDIIVEELASQARSVGFDSVEVGVYCGLPQFVNADAFGAAIDPASPLPNELTRTFLANRRLLRLRKVGQEAIVDSLRRDALGGSLHVHVVGDVVHARVENTGRATWLQRPGVGMVSVGAHLFASDGHLIDLDFMRILLGAGEAPLAPGAAIELIGELPDLGPGDFRIEFDLVAEHIAWFAENGNPTVTIAVRR
jgi:SAM-dependent methyltransferase